MTPALLGLGLQQLGANRKRLGLTGFSVVLSVGFMTAAIILGGGYADVIYGWGESQSAGVDLIVEPELPFEPLDFEVNPARIGDDALAVVAGTPGVAEARPVLWTDNRIRPELPSGDLVPNRFATTTQGWVDGGSLEIVEGSAPSRGQFTLDHETAADNGYGIGSTYGITTPTGTRAMVLSGLTDYRDDAGTTAGQVLVTFDLGELQEVLGEAGYVRLDVDTVAGVEADELRAALESRLPDGIDVLTRAEFQERLRSQVSPFANGFRYGLLGFAVLSVLVSAFIIHNTFTVLMSQRTREIGLLRAIGAGPGQIRSSVRAEAFLLGAVASVVGIGVGLGLSNALSALLRASSGLPDPDLSLTPGVAALGLTVGTGMTVAASAAPARRAGRIPVIAALDFGLGGGGAARGRLVVGGPPTALAGVPGRLAAQNIGRDARRSVTTAASLVVGLALVSLVLVVGQSAKERVAAGAAAAFDGDHVVASQDGYTYPIATRDALRELDEVAATTALSFDPVSIDGRRQYLTVADTAELDGLVDFDGSFEWPSSLRVPVWVTDTEASARDLSVGDEVSIVFFNGAEVTARIAGTYRNDAAGRGSYVIDRSTWVEHTGQSTVDVIVIRSASGVSAGDFDEAIDRFEEANAQLEVESIDAYIRSADDSINRSLGIVNVLMALTVLISFLGIANTIALATFERSREIGLLKAVGMQRRQVRRMIRYEAALVSLFGASVGAAVGAALGVAAVALLPASFVDRSAVPIDQIVGLVAVAVLVGALAAALPAWRAARTPLLELIR